MKLKQRRKKIIRRRRLKALLITLLILAAVSFAIAVLLEYKIKPMIAHTILHRVVSRYWTGDVSIADVEFNSSQATLVGRKISLRDDAGREWLLIGSINLHFEDWPSFRPTLSRVIIKNPNATLFADSGKLNLPWRNETGRSSQEKTPFNVHIKEIAIDDIWVEMVRTDAGDIIQPAQVEKLREMTIDGTASLRGDVKFSRENIADKFNAYADLNGNITMHEIVIDDLRKFLNREPLKNTQLTPLDIKDFTTKSLKYDNGVLEIPEMRGKVDGGEMWAKNFKLELIPQQPTRFFMDLYFSRLPLRQIYDAYDPTQNVKYGWASGKLEAVEYPIGKIEDLKVIGEIFLNDSDFDEMDIFRHINDHMKIDGKKIRNGSDVHLVFEIDKGIATINKGKVGNNLLAIHVIEGSKVDLKNKHLDMKVVVALLGDLREIPIIGFLFKLGDKLNELNVSGNWHEPGISSAVLDDLDKGTKEFFRGLVKTKGQMEEIEIPK